MTILLELVPQQTIGFAACQEAIRSHYQRRYAASPCPCPDEFVCLSSHHQPPPGLACAALSHGSDERFFSEYYLRGRRYLDIDWATRRRTVEFGAFCSFIRGQGKLLLASCFHLLKYLENEFLLMTATHKVRRLLSELDIDFTTLAIAYQRDVKDPSVEWGSYYANDPRVIFIALQDQTREFMPLEEKRICEQPIPPVSLV